MTKTFISLYKGSKKKVAFYGTNTEWIINDEQIFFLFDFYYICHWNGQNCFTSENILSIEIRMETNLFIIDIHSPL